MTIKANNVVMKNLIKLKIIILIIIFANILNTYSMNFFQDSEGIYCIKDDGSKAQSEWITFDFEADGLQEYYYFDYDGYLLVDTYTPDGYYVNHMGQWVVNGIVQHKMSPAVQPGFNPPVYNNFDVNRGNNDVKETTSISQQQNVHNYQTRKSYDGGSLLIFVLIFILILLTIFANISRSSYDEKTYRNNKNKKDSWDISKTYDTCTKKSEYELKTETDLIGEQGEVKAEQYLKLLDNKIFKILKNVKFKNKNGKPTQIDFICMTDKCSFVIEIKNWYGKIYGSVQDEKWYSKVNDETTNEQTNPIKQNQKHVERFRRELKNINIIMPIYSIIAFDERGTVMSQSIEDNRTKVIYIPGIHKIIQSIYSQQKGHLININFAYAHFKQYSDD